VRPSSTRSTEPQQRVVHEFGAHQTLISTPDLDKIDVRIGTILAVEDVRIRRRSYVCLSISATTRAPFSSA
jgi:hypothetical protein